VKRWGDRRAAVEVTGRRELLRASEGGGWFLLLILRDAAKAPGRVRPISFADEDERPKAVGYLFVLAIRISGAILSVWQQLPEIAREAICSPAGPPASSPTTTRSRVWSTLSLCRNSNLRRLFSTRRSIN
jgi:hypothetical protein